MVRAGSLVRASAKVALDALGIRWSAIFHVLVLGFVRLQRLNEIGNACFCEYGIGFDLARL